MKVALKKGRIQLVFMPLFLLLFLLGLSITVFVLDFIPWHNILGAILAVGSIAVPWVWWSYKVVKWKIWAFANVDDVKTLEKRAIAMQMIWPHGSWFEKTEIKSKNEKKVLEWLYAKIESSSSKREQVFDNSLPEELIIHYPKWTGFFYLLMIPLSAYLWIEGNWIYGILGTGMGAYLSFNSFKKVRSDVYLMKINSNGVILKEGFVPWDDIKEYYIERSGHGESSRFSLLIKGDEIFFQIPLQDINTNAFTIERYMDVYRTRHEMKSSR